MTAANPLARIADWPVPHAAAAVVSPTGVLATAGDPDRLFALASVTKPLTGLATLVAVEEGALDLDTPLDTVAELPGISVRQLLSHASGIHPERRSRAAAPGTRRIYSNAGYDVLGETVAAATQMPFERYLAEAVFAPLQLVGARLDGSPAKDGVASVTHLSRVLSEWLAPTGLLHADTLADATSVQFPGLRGVLPGYGAQEHNDWGLGVEIRDHKSPHWTSARNSPATFGHFGRSGTMVWVDPQARLGLVALSDRDFDKWAIAAWPELSDAVLDAFG
jgi:CubicO group peptidase (beta-lactamase class C family)